MRSEERGRKGCANRKTAALLAAVLLAVLAGFFLPAGVNCGGRPDAGNWFALTAQAAETGEESGAQAEVSKEERGWHTTPNGKYHYYVLKDGSRAKGWRKIGSRTYYFGPKKGYRYTGFHKIDGKRYYFGPKGALRSGWITVKGKKYYADPAKGCALAKGMTKVGKYTYFFKKKTNEMRTSCWLKIKGSRYYFKANGRMAKGWEKIGGKTYYFRKKTGARASGWLKIKGYYYYFDEKGIPLKNTYAPNGKYLDADGKRLRRSTLKKFLKTALGPVGSTLYVWGGGWNESDTGAGPEAVTIGVPSSWKRFFAQNGSGYDYRNTRYQIHNGLDCSGYVGWAVYNAFNTKSGNAGYVCLAQDMARTFAQKGWGTYRSSGQVRSYRAGDIMSSSGHVYIVVGSCADGSIVLLHSSPQGVMLSGTATRSGSYASEAIGLANRYMRKYYPAWTARYPDSSRGPGYLRGYSQMRWNLSGNHMMTDPDGYRSKSAAAILADLFD